jgi:plasmid stabilization system protein ParE
MMKIFFSEKAILSINNISKYIASESYPEKAVKFSEELYNYAEKIAFYPTKHNICKSKILASKQIRCAIFHNYIFLFRINNDVVYILNVVHSKRFEN